MIGYFASATIGCIAGVLFMAIIQINKRDE